ncbi:hypothetical protein FSP39_020731 [Pinctada imbricata]|uniref:GATA zinc finger domain-containing protein 1 n=1 Tax=Pinctada imbricata TaxID=66713 RepID=A0AA89CCW6_PINIB|nr:hypothetical protein FSP39_020731 [Pinctada imbricata]
MPFGQGSKPTCTVCKTTTSTIWRKNKSNEVVCNLCHQNPNSARIEEQPVPVQAVEEVVPKASTKPVPPAVSGKESPVPTTAASAQPEQRKPATSNNSNGNGNGAGPILRKSARIKPSKHRFQSATKAIATKGKSRRITFKKSQPIKAPTAVSTVVTGDSIFHDGMYYQTGDVVSLVDHDGSVYYAQIRGFMEDQYNDKSAVISWLLPTQNSPPGHFDPATYILGPEEDLPRRLEFMEFVCHAPSDYYKCRFGPFPTIDQSPELCYIWTNVGEQIQLVPSSDEIFGLKDPNVPEVPKQMFTGKSKEEKLGKGDKHKKQSEKDKVKVKEEASKSLADDVEKVIKKEAMDVS